jgi:hypothetical protein
MRNWSFQEICICTCKVYHEGCVALRLSLTQVPCVQVHLTQYILNGPNHGVPLPIALDGLRSNISRLRIRGCLNSLTGALQPCAQSRRCSHTRCRNQTVVHSREQLQHHRFEPEYELRRRIGFLHQRQASVIICFMFDLSADQSSSETTLAQALCSRLAPPIIGTGLFVTCPA